MNGAAEEDLPEPRVVHHFHNPLAPSWAEAGLTVGLLQWISSNVWQQQPSQSTAPGVRNGPGNWAWPDARERFYRALTATAPGEREAGFADLFRTLGQTMHVVQDASVPAHTRNDPHLRLRFGSIVLYHDPDGYERYVDTLASNPATFAALLGLLPTVLPAEGIYGPVGISSRVDRASAPVPVSALIDSGQYVGTNPEVTATPGDGPPVIGLAEYSNANFFSKDTTALNRPSLLESFPHPAPTDLVLGPPTPAGPSGPLRRYFRKPGAGDPIEYLAVPSALYEFLPDALKDRQVGLDPRVLEHYAEKLLPRAVGYSAALLDYFFRGAFGAELSDSGVRVFNHTAGESATGAFQLLREDPDGTREELARWENVSVAPGGGSDVLPVATLPGDTPPGTRCWLIFRGRLGGEPDAVAGSPASCPTEAPSIAPLWYVYTCKDWAVTIRYNYATQDPPRDPDGLYLFQFIVPGSWPVVICSKVALLRSEGQPINTVSTHPI
ncbi:MAG TPA: hypothetical protein VHF87_16785 [Methylomirabilota bacterium]|jgi:hypothetical protein|nr:hypothetical protein [Methylomirabilota bacterium]